MKPGSKEWLEKLTGSQFGAAVGINPYMSRQKLFRTIKGTEPPFHGNDATDWGTKHEPTNISAYEVYTGNIVSPPDFYLHRSIEWMGVTPDGLIDDDGLVECKCPFSLKIYETIPPYYMAQVQGQLEVMEKDWCHFSVWTPEEIEVTRVERSNEYWEWMKPLLEEFWEYVTTDVEPKRKKKPVPPEVTTEKL